MNYDTIIIGGGPAGLTAALYASRRSLQTLVLTKDIGGQAAKTFDIENYPGLEHTTGPAFAMTLKKQAENFGTKISYEEVKSITKNENDSFAVKTSGQTYTAKSIILALGKKPKELEVPGEKEFIGKGVSYCATCDAPFFKNKTVVVVGGGNSALDAAIVCSKFASQVYILHRSTFSGEKTMIDKVNATANIEVKLSEEVAEIKGDNIVSSLILKSGQELKTDGVIVEIGYVVDRTLIEGLVEMNEKNQVVANANQETSVPGIFAAGDLTTTVYKQIVIAAGEGAKAALSAYDYIMKIEGKKGISGDWQHLNK